MKEATSMASLRLPVLLLRSTTLGASTAHSHPSRFTRLLAMRVPNPSQQLSNS